MISKVLPVVILAGGKGTRLREETEFIPKPMVKIGNLPILLHIINHFEKFGKFNFLVCTGYKEEIIFEYFKKYPKKNIKLISTGLNTLTAGRIKKTREFIDDEFIMTYGDGLSDINISNLYQFHNSHKGSATISVTKPVSRFGLIEFQSNGLVTNFVEKPLLNSFINMGYMVLNCDVFNYIDQDEMFESTPLKKLSNDRKIFAYKHGGFFMPMDTYRDYLELAEIYENGNAPWI